ESPVRVHGQPAALVAAPVHGLQRARTVPTAAALPAPQGVSDGARRARPGVPGGVARRPAAVVRPLPAPGLGPVPVEREARAIKPEQLRSQCSQFKARARRLPTPLLMDSLKRCARRLYARTRLRTPSLASDNTWASSASRRRRRRRIKKPPAVRLDGKAVLLGKPRPAAVATAAPPARRPGRKPEVTARLWLKFFELQSDARKKGLRNERLLADFRDDLKTEHMWNLVSFVAPF
ncbi:unnamed protein product, partial [Ixodes hexagonus]